jgi:predicted DNA binding CopG/RHH family protein
MTDDNIQPINDPKEIPNGLSDEEQLAYWEKHGLTEDYLQKTEEVPEDERPRARTRSISVRFDGHTINRLKNLADKRGIGYQTLLKEFVTERLYEEEKREGLPPFDSPRVSEQAAAAAAFNMTWDLLMQGLTEAAEAAPEKLSRPAAIRMLIEEAFSEGWRRFKPEEPGWHPWLSEEAIEAEGNIEAQGKGQGNIVEPRYYPPARGFDPN